MSEPARLVFLPKYCPDLNPIEQVFAKFKTLLRKAGARTDEAISRACGKILAQCPPAECAARFNPDMKAKYAHLIETGKPAKVALTSIMRKLVVLANALLKANRPWTPKIA